MRAPVAWYSIVQDKIISCEVMQRLFIILLFLLLIHAEISLAVEVQGLFEAEVITQSQSLKDRNKAIKDALAIVFGKIMAGENIFDDPTVKMALEDAPRYTTRYRYSLIPSNSDENSARLMRVEFDQNALLELLRASKLGIWNEVRDETLIWLVVEKNGKKQIFDEQLMPDIANALTKAAKRKGIPLLFPLMDLEESQKITIPDILGAYSDKLLEVSKRYATPAILVGRLKKYKKCWKTEWALYFNNDIKQWNSECVTLDEAILSGMEGTYDKLSKFYAVKPDTLEIDTVILKVSGVKNMTDMSKITDYLNSLPMTESVNWLKVKSGINYYKVKTSGSRRAFIDAVGLGRILDPLDPEDLQEENELKYRLLPDTAR